MPINMRLLNFQPLWIRWMRKFIPMTNGNFRLRLKLNNTIDEQVFIDRIPILDYKIGYRQILHNKLIYKLE